MNVLIKLIPVIPMQHAPIQLVDIHANVTMATKEMVAIVSMSMNAVHNNTIVTLTRNALIRLELLFVSATKVSMVTVLIVLTLTNVTELVTIVMTTQSVTIRLARTFVYVSKAFVGMGTSAKILTSVYNHQKYVTSMLHAQIPLVHFNVIVILVTMEMELIVKVKMLDTNKLHANS